MNYIEFKKTFGHFPIIATTQIFSITRQVQPLRNQLSRWQKRGLIIKLKKGLYVLNENDRKINPSRIFLANILCSPSYVSTEYALHYYDLIPEQVYDVTSVTTKNVSQFKNQFGTFIYQHLKTDLFFGFKEILDENKLPVLIAEPEKAILDFIYLNLAEFKDKAKDVFGESYRLQNLDRLKKTKLLTFAKRYNKTVLAVVNKLLEYWQEFRP
jgi:predicted transcriptional regulator of viral defense system|uniref:Transcriptional regulator n=1 Tax=candidate division WOR-3 bacterium TaxID=2052148 RepID=A0A7C6AA73_UNCW3